MLPYELVLALLTVSATVAGLVLNYRTLTEA